MQFFRAAAAWSTGLLFFLANQMLMTDIFYRPFFGLTFDAWYLIIIGGVASFALGLLLTITGEMIFTLLLKRLKPKRLLVMSEGAFSDQQILFNLYGFSFGMVIIFGIKFFLELKLYNLSNIQYVVLFLIFFCAIHLKLLQMPQKE
ncbi:MAG: hypothetical protein Q7I98_04985 [Erysipelotrichaceae bacterium]|nr:hypothetical protein [Erysipelotrichaceae bacterium]